MIMVCEVHCASEIYYENDRDWYGMLHLQPTKELSLDDVSEDEGSVKKQFKKLALILHPDKNSFPGATEAFKLIKDANHALSDKTTRVLHNLKRKYHRPVRRPTPRPPAKPEPTPTPQPTPTPTPTPKPTPKPTPPPPPPPPPPPQQPASSKRQAHPSTASFSANTPKRRKVIIESSDSESSESPVKREPEVVILSDDDEKPGEVKQPQEDEMKTQKEEKQPQEEDKQPLEEDVEEENEKRTQEEEKQPQEEDKQPLKEDVEEENEKRTQEEDKQPQEEDKQPLKEDVQEEHEKRTQEEDREPEEDDSSTDRIWYDAADFNDFLKSRDKNCFKSDQIWAVYAGKDGMPSVYALIKEVTNVDFKIQFVWLDLAEDHAFEIPDVPVSVGKFEMGEEDETNDPTIFSHLVCSVTGRVTRTRTFTVFPKKGETWALYKNWDSVSPLKYEYDIVEILSDYAGEGKVSVRFLSKIDAYISVFYPVDGSFEIIPAEFCRFSHCIPSFRLNGTGGVSGGCYELDPAAIPPV